MAGCGKNPHTAGVSVVSVTGVEGKGDTRRRLKIFLITFTVQLL